MRTKAKNQEILKYDVFISYKSQYVNIVGSSAFSRKREDKMLVCSSRS